MSSWNLTGLAVMKSISALIGFCFVVLILSVYMNMTGLVTVAFDLLLAIFDT